MSTKCEELKEFTDFLTADRVSKSTRLPLMLDMSIEGIKSEDDDLQVEHLVTLKNGIRQHFRAVTMTLSGETSKDLETQGKERLGELIRLLLARCTHHNFHVRRQAVSCLGQLSAIEPSRVPPMEQLMKKVVSAAEQSDDDLAIHILNEHVVKLLMVGSSKRSRYSSLQQGVIEFSIQELLKFLEIDKIRDSITAPAKVFRQASSTQYAMSQHAAVTARGGSETGSKRGRDNWMKLEQKDIIAPWLFTDLNVVQAPHEPRQAVLYRVGMHYENWVRQFCAEVVMRCQGPRGQLLKYIIKILKKDYDLATFVLSPAVLHLLCSGGEGDVDFVSNELMSVLNHAFDSGKFDEGDVVEMVGAGCFRLRSLEVPPHADEVLGMELKLSCGESRNIVQAYHDRERLTVVHVQPPFSDAVTSESVGGYSIAKGEYSSQFRDKIEGSTQVVFKILDDLTCLLEHYSRTFAARGRHCPDEVLSKKEALQRFLKKIPRRILAKASCQCAAYDRALLYLEDSIREQWQLSHAPQRASSDRVQLPVEILKGLLGSDFM